MKTKRTAVWIICFAVVLTILLVVLGPRRLLRRGRSAFDRSRLILTGRLVDVGGRRLHIERMGKGGPTVVMDAGLCQPLTTWGGVPSEVSTFTSVFTYDRAGIGRSDAGPKPRTSQNIVDDLHTLLKNSGVPGPYVLVGHSFGGFNIRLYASQYPEEVAGMVFIDATHVDERSRYAPLLRPEERAHYLEETTQNYERVDLDESAAQVRRASPLRQMPLVVLTAPAAPDSTNPLFGEMERAKTEMQADLARLVPNSTHIFVDNSSHFIQLDHPEIVIKAIREVVEKARHAPTESSHADIPAVVPLKIALMTVQGAAQSVKPTL